MEPLEVSSSVEGPDYWKFLAIELIKRIPPIPPETTPKFDNLADRVARCNSKVYHGKFDPVQLEE